jgi:hypothetical protein
MDPNEARKNVNDAIASSGSAAFGQLVDTASSSKRKREQNQREKEAREKEAREREAREREAREREAREKRQFVPRSLPTPNFS